MIYNEDAVKWANEYTGPKFHALLCDAPYHLTSITERFGKKGSRPPQEGVYKRVSKGFMQTTWDGGDVAFRPETWEAFGKVLYDGAFGMAFSASRNWHRMAVAIEDAGFIIHPTMFFLWINGQGFPKATRVKGDEVFDGHRYGLQALKPAVEPIIIFQKPYNGKPVDNMLETGAGALNIDASRIPLAVHDEYVINTFDDGAKPWGDGAGHKYTSRKVGADASQLRTMNRSKKTSKDGWGMNDNESDNPQVVQESGRWPANFVLDEESARRLDEQTGTLTSGKPSGKKNIGNGYHENFGSIDVTGFGDSGGASRFFNKVSTTLDEADPFLYCGKVMPKERNAGMDGEKNDHPTLKPIELSKYLATLLLPPNEYAPRRLFVPFSGSGSEMIGAYLAGWEEVVGVEFDTENGYVDIAKKRIQHWTGKQE